MLETFTVASFAPHQGDTFIVRADEQVSLTMTLSEVTPLGTAPGDGSRRAPFSLLFHGPPAPVLPQRIYRLEHVAIGAFDLFLVPLGPDQVGMRYQAVFG
jgi:hypothetical protein